MGLVQKIMGIKLHDVNQNCDCGSGLKLKDCHLKPSIPNEFFTVRITTRTSDYFAEYKNGQYRKIPGRIIMNVSVIDPKFVYEDVIDLLKELRSVKNVQAIKLERFSTIVKELHLERNQDATIKLFKNRLISLVLFSMAWILIRCFCQ
jgi:hypothetical protein